MAGYKFLGETPFDTVYLHGVVRDTQHRKMSKSLGNGIDPLAVVERYGADAMRYTVIAGNATGADVMLDPDDLDTSFSVGRNFANKIWNVGRFILSNFGEDPIGAIDPDKLELADRWILSRADQAISDVTDQLSQHRFSDAAQVGYHFFWDELADWYVEQVKPRLYGNEPGGETARAVLLHVFSTSLRLLHPLMPFLTEELWSHLPQGADGMLASSDWPEEAGYRNADVERQFGLVQDLVRSVRSVRAEYNVSPAKPVPVFIDGADEASTQAWNAELSTIGRLGKIEPLTINEADSGNRGAGGHAVLPSGASVFVPLGDAIDLAKECARLRNEHDRIEGAIGGVRKKLANENFVSRAPDDVVEQERRKEQEWSEQQRMLAAKLQALGC
jgi:valyl-tRNA synthetase